MERNAETIKHDVLATAIEVGQMDGFSMEWNVNGEKATFGVKVVE